MTLYDWNEEKNEQLRTERGVTFEEIVFHLTHGGLLDTIENPNQKKYAEQEGRTRVSSTIDARYGSLRNAGETYLHYIGGIRGKRDMWLKDDKQNRRNFSQGQRVY